MGLHVVPPLLVVQLKRFVYTSQSLFGPSKVGIARGTNIGTGGFFSRRLQKKSPQVEQTRGAEEGSNYGGEGARGS